jgi:hypothetical protein
MDEKVWGDGNWVAQWVTAVFHQNMFGYLVEKQIVSLGVLSEEKFTNLLMNL